MIWILSAIIRMIQLEYSDISDFLEFRFCLVIANLNAVNFTLLQKFCFNIHIIMMPSFNF